MDIEAISRLHVMNIIKHPMSYVLCCCINYAQSIIKYAHGENMINAYSVSLCPCLVHRVTTN